MTKLNARRRLQRSREHADDRWFLPMCSVADEPN